MESRLQDVEQLKAEKGQMMDMESRLQEVEQLKAEKGKRLRALEDKLGLPLASGSKSKKPHSSAGEYSRPSNLPGPPSSHYTTPISC